jgi:putative membrane protein
MTSLRMAFTELRRVTAGRLPRMAVAALVLVPTLYGGLYLYANHDPYRNLKYVPAALVVSDTGARDSDGNDVNAGQEVADQLQRDAGFDWHRVSPAQAESGVRAGTYDFALTIPRDFSAALTSSATFDPQQAQLRMTTNDANSYLSTTIANQVTEKVRSALAAKVGTEAASNFLLGISDTRSGLLDATQGATQLLDGVAKASHGTQSLSKGADTLSSGATDLSKGLGTIADKTKDLPDQLDSLATGAQQVADGNTKVAAIGDKVATYSSQATSTYDHLRGRLIAQMRNDGVPDFEIERLTSVFDGARGDIHQANKNVQDAAGKLDALSSGATQVAAATKKLDTDLPKALDGIAAAKKGADRLATGAGRIDDGARRLDDGLAAVTQGGAELRDKLQQGADRIPVMDAKTRDKVAQTIGNPVDVSSVSDATAGSYGAGLAPFFLALAAWIGGYVLFLLLRPLSTRALAANQTPLRVAVGGWLPAALIGAAQMAVLSVLVLAALHIRPVHIAGTFGFLVLTSASFVAIVHCLNAWFGKPGQFLGLVLMVLQLVTAGGTFPWQTIPAPLHWLHTVLPMSYAVDGLRQLMYGGAGTRVWTAVAVLAGYLVVALVLTAVAARTRRVWSVQRVRPELALG